MKKILVLTYFYPPCNLPGASRVSAWSKYLHVSGYFPIIVTRKWENDVQTESDINSSTNGNIIHEKTDTHEVYYLPFQGNIRDQLMVKPGGNYQKFVRKTLSFFELLLQNYTNEVIPFRNIYDFSDELLNKDKEIGLIIATGVPFVLFKFASQLSQKHNIKWIADYRDEWTTAGPEFKKDFIYRNTIEKFEKHFEKKWVSTAELLLSVSDLYTKKISSFVGIQGKTIYNGYFDEDILPDNQNIKPYNIFTITYLGSLYPSQNIELLIDALSLFAAKYGKNRPIRLFMPGAGYEPNQFERVKNYVKGRFERVIITKRIPREKAIESLYKSHLLLLFSYGNQPGVLTTKIFEYLVTNKPILLCPSTDKELEILIKSTGTGYFADTVSEVLEKLEEIYDKYLQKYQPDKTTNQIQFFSRRTQTFELSKILNEVWQVPQESNNSIIVSDNEKKKKILILAYDFPPFISVGALRPYNWYKYLGENGFHPVVITRQWNNKFGNHLDYVAPSESRNIIIENNEQGTIIRTPYFPNFANRIMLKYGESKFIFFRKLISAFYVFSQYLFFVGPKKQLYFAATEYLEKNKVEGIIASGEPFILFKYASFLSRKHNNFWIADYRDPWTHNVTLKQNPILRTWSSIFEKQIVKSSSMVLTVSEFFKAQISELLGNKKILILPNGFDQDLLHKTMDIKQEDKVLTIGFAGTIYKYHPIRSFIKVVSQVARQRPDFKIHIKFFGLNNSEEVEEIIRNEFSCSQDCFSIHPKLPNEEVLLQLAKCNLLLLFNYYSIVGTKIYDYLALKRAILFCYSNDPEAEKLKKKYYKVNEIKGLSPHPQEDLIKATNSGYIVKNEEHLAQLLVQLLEYFLENKNIPCQTSNYEDFSRKTQTAHLASILNKEINNFNNYRTNCELCGHTSFSQLDYFKYGQLLKCKKCGFVESRKTPIQEEHKYQHLESDNKSASSIIDKRYNDLLDYFEPFRKNNTLLDIGCGDGRFLEIARKRGWKTFGTETNDDLIEHCKNKGLTVVNKSQCLNLLPLNTFDIITSFEFIQHLLKPDNFTLEINKLLRKDGLAYITTPNFSSFSRILSGKRWSSVHYPEHLSYFTPVTLARLFEQNGFEKNKIKTTGISISKIKEKETDSGKIDTTSSNHYLNSVIENSKFAKWAKNLINEVLTLVWKGETIKAFFIKK